MKLHSMLVSSSFIAIGVLLPFLTLNNPALGQILLLMHIPIFISGFFLKPQYAFLIGLITPLLRSVLLSAPPLYPIAIVMSMELATYGLLVSLLFRLFRTKYLIFSIYMTLLLSMIGGRIVWGIAASFFYNLAGHPDFSIPIFISSAFIVALPGIAIQLIFIPIVVVTLLQSRSLNVTLAS